MKQRLKSKWSDFIGMLRSKAEVDDQDQIFVDDFVSTLLFYKIKLS